MAVIDSCMIAAINVESVIIPDGSTVNMNAVDIDVVACKVPLRPHGAALECYILDGDVPALGEPQDKWALFVLADWDMDKFRSLAVNNTMSGDCDM